jgi:hypothetical protein
MPKSPVTFAFILTATALLSFTPSRGSDTSLDEEDLENGMILRIIKKNRAQGFSDMSDQTLTEIGTYLSKRDSPASSIATNTETKEPKTE